MDSDNAEGEGAVSRRCVRMMASCLRVFGVWYS